MATELKRRLFTATEYHQMAEAGILGEDDRVELIEGEVIEMTLFGLSHASCVARLDHILGRELGDAVVVWPQNFIHLSEHSESQPDLMLLRPRPDFYAEADPVPADVLLLIEVSDTTLDCDPGVKVPQHAKNAIPEVWIMDL